MPTKKSGKTESRSPQLVVRITETLEGDLLLAAKGLGIDLSNLVRMILTEHVAEYITRGRKAKLLTAAARAKKKPKSGHPSGDDENPALLPDSSDDDVGGQRPGLDL